MYYSASASVALRESERSARAEARDSGNPLIQRSVCSARSVGVGLSVDRLV